MGYGSTLFDLQSPTAPAVDAVEEPLPQRVAAPAPAL
jgi:hypothetical protein